MTFLPNENQFQMSYSRRVDRPGLEQTKPIREFSTQGNFCWKSLEPQFTNSLELNYTKTIKRYHYHRRFLISK
jgi:hypothetical protein